MSIKLRTAVMGLGWAGCHRHIPALIKHPSFDLVGIIDGKANHIAAIAKQYGIPFSAQTHDLGDVPWMDSIDALVLATPPDTHATLAIAALSQGKHVLVEKPFAYDTPQALAMQAAAQSNNRILAAAHNFLFCRSYQKLRRDLKRGKLGLLTEISGTYLNNRLRPMPAWHRTLPLGALANELPHFLYLIHDLTGGVLHLRRAHAIAGKDSCTPALVQLLYSSHTNIPITLSYSFTGALSEWHLMIKGDKATAFIDLYRDIYILIPNDGAHKIIDVVRTSASVIAQHLYQHIPNAIALLKGKMDYGTAGIYDQFAVSVETNQPAPGIGFDDAVAVAKLQSEATKTILGNLYS